MFLEVRTDFVAVVGLVHHGGLDRAFVGHRLEDRIDNGGVMLLARRYHDANSGVFVCRREVNWGAESCATTEPIDWLRDKIFLHVYGERVGEDVLSNFSKEAFVGLYNQERHGRSLPNNKFQDHFEGRDTYYFFNPNKTGEYALAMIDIDVLKSRMLGSPEGARQFATFLRTLFPYLYVEASTGGKGQHAYLLVHKLGYSAEEVKKWLKHLERWLRQQAKGVRY